MSWRERLGDFILEEVGQVSRLSSAARTSVRLFFHLGRKAWDDQVLPRAAALSFFTVLNLIPLGGLALFILSHSPVLTENLAAARQALVGQLVTPAAQRIAEDMFTTLSKNLSVLGRGTSGILTVLLLLLFSNSLMIAVERSLNEIFRSGGGRAKVFQRILLLWGGFLLMVVFLGASFALTARLSQIHPSALRLAKYLLPFGATFTAFFFLYRIVPRTRMSLKAVIPAALAAGFLWESAKLGLSWYVRMVFAHSHVGRFYGSLGLIPIGLIWIYYAWIIILLGAELAFVLQHFDQLQADARRRATLGAGFVPLTRELAIAMAAEVLRAERVAHGPADMGDLLARYQVSPMQASRWFDALAESGVTESGTECLVPAPTAGATTLASLSTLYDRVFMDILPHDGELLPRLYAGEPEVPPSWKARTLDEIAASPPPHGSPESP